MLLAAEARRYWRVHAHRIRRRWLTGFLTALAIAVKLTPLLFLLYFVARKQWSYAFRASFGEFLLTLSGILTDPEASRTYLTSGVRQVSAVSHWDGVGNQSLRAVLARLGSTSHMLPIALSGLLLLVLWWWFRTRPMVSEVTEWTLMGLATLIVSPITWTHHRGWLMVPLFSHGFGNGAPPVNSERVGRLPLGTAP